MTIQTSTVYINAQQLGYPEKIVIPEGFAFAGLEIRSSGDHFFLDLSGRVLRANQSAPRIYLYRVPRTRIILTPRLLKQRPYIGDWVRYNDNWYQKATTNDLDTQTIYDCSEEEIDDEGRPLADAAERERIREKVLQEVLDIAEESLQRTVTAEKIETMKRGIKP